MGFLIVAVVVGVIAALVALLGLRMLFGGHWIGAWLRGTVGLALVAVISSWTVPGSVMAWPARGTMRKCASGQAATRSQAFCSGVITS